jgi:hypothetical protein
VNGRSIDPNDNPFYRLTGYNLSGMPFSTGVHIHHSVAGLEGEGFSGASDEAHNAGKTYHQSVIRRRMLSANPTLRQTKEDVLGGHFRLAVKNGAAGGA